MSKTEVVSILLAYRALLVAAKNSVSRNTDLFSVEADKIDKATAVLETLQARVIIFYRPPAIEQALVQHAAAVEKN